MATKTKAMLEEELKQKQKEIKQLKTEMKQLERFKQYEDMAGEIKGMYDAYINAGFDEKTASKLLTATLQVAGAMATNNGPSIRF